MSAASPTQVPSTIGPPPEIEYFQKWGGTLRTHLAVPNWVWVLAFLAGFSFAFCVSPAGRIATFIDGIPIDHDWFPAKLSWWRAVMAVLAIAIALISLVLLRGYTNDLRSIKQRLTQVRNLLIVSGVELVLTSTSRWSIRCHIRTFRALSNEDLPSTIFLGTAHDLQKHQLTYNRNSGVYEGGADASAFNDAILTDMQATSLNIQRGFVRVSLTTHDKNWRMVGANDNDETAWVVAVHGLDLPPEPQP